MDFVDDSPDWIPVECKEAIGDLLSDGNNHKYEQECRCILSDDRLKSFWHDAGASFSDYWMSQEKPGGIHLGGLRGFFRSLIFRMAIKGGKLPTENLKDKKKRRITIAKQVKKLWILINQDEWLSRIGLNELAEFCAEFEKDKDVAGRGKSAVDILRTYRNPNNEYSSVTAAPMLSMVGPKLPDMLKALEEQLEQFRPVHSFDSFEYHHAVPQIGRNNAQQIYLERQLVEFFTIYTGASSEKLVALAVEAAIDTAEAIDQNDLGSRHRNYKKRLP